MKSFIKTALIFSMLASFAFGTVRIMPMGDSITYDYNYADKKNPRPDGLRKAYRAPLWYMLEDADYPADFVGSLVAGQDVVPPFDPDNEGHPGWTSFDMAARTYDFLSYSDPDIVLLHIGTNDRTTTSPDGVRQILDEMDRYERDTGHHIKAFVALIIDRKEHDSRIEIFNQRLKDMLIERIAQGDDIVIVDMYHDAGLTPSDYADNTHPNDKGYQKMAKVWFAALQAHPYDPNGTPPTLAATIPVDEYPYVIVPKKYIRSIKVRGNTVTFITEVPDNGIVFK